MVTVWHPVHHVGPILVSASMMGVLVSPTRIDVLLVVL